MKINKVRYDIILYITQMMVIYFLGLIGGIYNYNSFYGIISLILFSLILSINIINNIIKVSRKK